MCAAHTHVPEKSTRQSMLSSFAMGRMISLASFLVATISLSCSTLIPFASRTSLPSTSVSPLSRSAFLERSIMS